MTTSYYGMFVLPENDALQINRIEIPLIQRDYAQGRKGERVRRIRDAFLEVLCPAVAPGGAPADLDFIYGEVNNGTLIPLDGQQRLTTLFLLHWYLAVRVGHPVQGQPWMQFSYATRPSARRFCERLSQYQPPILLPLYSEWIKDQVWYFATWCHDPTVSSMLVMLDAIHERLGGIDCQAAWARLTDPETPAITFQLLPVKWTGHSDDLYIKMNSRGKPLTEFEHFKARFEQWHCPNAGILADKLDDAWSHLFWQFHGDDGIVDDEFLRYIRFVTEVCVWRGGEALPERDLTALAASVYGPHVERQRRASNLDFLIDAFDTWGGLDIPNLFSHIFTVDLANGGHDQVLLFGPQGAEGTNLFAGCCRRYGNMRGDNGTFSLAQTLLFYGVLLHRLHETPDLPRRLRVLRNLIEASSNEIRLDRMPGLLADVQRVVVDGTLDGVAWFKTAQVVDERLKKALLELCPDLGAPLFQLEDHPRLRGCLAAFELDELVFAQRAQAFECLFPPGGADDGVLLGLTGALLAVGDYSRRWNQRMIQLGSSRRTESWLDLLTGAGRAPLAGTRQVLGDLLDRLALAQGDPLVFLTQVQTDWLAATVEAEGLDWRWYLVRYPVMRDGRSGIYASQEGGDGYHLCMLEKVQVNGYYRDPFLSAIHSESAVGDAVQWLWFIGYETQPRWLRLTGSGTGLRCVSAGILCDPPALPAHINAFAAVCAQRGIGADGLLAVPQVQRNGVMLDTEDRVQLGANLLQDLVNAGL